MDTSEANSNAASKPTGAPAGFTPGRLKQPTRIALGKPLSFDPTNIGGLVKAAPQDTEPARPELPENKQIELQDEPEPKPEDFKVHKTSLKRKPEDPPPAAPAARNTKARTGSTSSTLMASTASARAKAATSTVARSTIASRAATAKTSAASTTRSTTARSSTLSTRPSATASRASVRSVSSSSSTASAATAAKAAEKASSGDAAAPGPKKKRPAWDVKGRLQDLEEFNHQTQSQLSDSRGQLEQVTSQLYKSQETINELSRFREQLQSQVIVKEKESSTYALQLNETKHELQSVHRKYEEEMSFMRSRHNRELDDVKHDLDTLQRKHESICADLKVARDENASLRATISTQSASTLAIEAEMRANKIKLEQTEDLLRQREERIASLEASLAAANENVSALEIKVREEETVRRRLHNTILELKGNIRVFCRVRPPLGSEVVEKSDECMTHISFADNDEKAIVLNHTVDSASGAKSALKTIPFSFDKVFQPNSKQAEVFEEISQLVQSALDGYNVCIFAYGQTGSGKTFTMEGPEKEHLDEESMGMIPRAVQQIFDTAQALKDKGWEYQMEAQFLEIYNESIRDLLGKGSEDKKHDIKHHPATGKTSVTDVNTVNVTTPREVHTVLRKAAQNRAVAATNCNERSSRSHSVFTLRLTGKNSLTDETSEGILNLIDLAGSERLSASGSTGDRLKETQAINKSLSCLGDVIYALANKDQHIPYRNSKLTYLLQNSLGGNSKTLMFVNVSPLAGNFQETLCSLRFATKVNNCQIGTARKNMK